MTSTAEVQMTYAALQGTTVASTALNNHGLAQDVSSRVLNLRK